MNITLREIEISRNEIKARKGEYLPLQVLLRVPVPINEAFTWNGQSEEDWKGPPAKTPRYIGDFSIGAFFSWELDIWKKLRNAKNAAAARYLASVEGQISRSLILSLK